MNGPTTPGMRINVQKTNESFTRTRTEGPDPVIGNFTFVIDITSTEKDLYIPISIASGKKPTGFMYQIEGTGQGLISTTDISCRGNGITQITLGTITYCKIPVGTTATFRIHIEMKGKVGKSYSILLSQINYKNDPSAARYQKSLQQIRTKTLKFS